MSSLTTACSPAALAATTERASGTVVPTERRVVEADTERAIRCGVLLAAGDTIGAFSADGRLLGEARTVEAAQALIDADAKGGAR